MFSIFLTPKIMLPNHNQPDILFSLIPAVNKLLINWLMQCHYIIQERVYYMAHLLQIQIANLNWVPTLHRTHV